MNRTPEPPPSGGAATGRRLDSWKEIAAYLGRGVRTVQRWEREEGLPVHRLAHAERGSVFADANELSAWWNSRLIKPDATTPARPEGDRDTRFHRVTHTTGSTSWPSLSSDGRMIVYVSDGGKDGAPPQVWLQQIGGAALQLTTGLHDCTEPSFAANDTRVIFTATGESGRNVYEVSALGGPPRVLRREARSARFSRDGRWLVYLGLDPSAPLRLVSADGGDEQTLAPELRDVSGARWSEDDRHLIVLARPGPDADHDCWVVPIDGGSPIDTGVLRAGRQQGFIAIPMPPAWTGDSVFYAAAGRQGLHLWRQRLSPDSSLAVGAPEQVTPGPDWAHFPSATGDRLTYVAMHADTNIWSVAIDVSTGKTHGPLRRLTRGTGIVSYCSVSRDGRTLAYFAARTIHGELRLRHLDRDEDVAVDGEAGSSRGFPALSPDGRQLAYSSIVHGPPVERPIHLTNLADGQPRLVTRDCGGRPRQWLDDKTLILETVGAANAFLRFEIDAGTTTPLLSSADRHVSNPRVSPDGRWLAFDVSIRGGTPSVSIAPVDPDGRAIPESSWIPVQDAASHPFWSWNGDLLYFLPATPTVSMRNRVVARPFDPNTGRLGDGLLDVITLTEMNVPAMLVNVTPIVARDQMIFVLGDFRGDVWIVDL